MVRLDLIRHARTRWNLEKRLQGRADLPLCPEGIEDAEKWADRLKGKPYDLILASPMKRARETATIIAGSSGVSIESLPGLEEQDFGSWEGRSIRSLRKESPGEIEDQEKRGWAFCPPKGESRTRVLKRATTALRGFAERFDGKQILVVSHNTVVKTLIYHALKRSFLPDEPTVLKAYHLHELIWDKDLAVAQLNCIDLMGEAKEE